MGSKQDLREEGESRVSFADGTPAVRVGSRFGDSQTRWESSLVPPRRETRVGIPRCEFPWPDAVLSPRPTGTVRILLQGGARIHRRLLRLRQLQVKKEEGTKEKKENNIHTPKHTTEELPSLIFCNILFVNIPPPPKKQKSLCIYLNCFRGWYHELHISWRFYM